MFLEGPTLSLSVSHLNRFPLFTPLKCISAVGSRVKKLGSHFPLSMIHTDMFVQGLLRLCCLSTNFTAVLKRVRKVDTFYVIEHICFQGIYVATDSALE